MHDADALLDALAAYGLAGRAVATATVETPDLHRLTWRGGRFRHRCPHGGEGTLAARGLQSAAAEFAAAVQADRAMLARPYIETAPRPALSPPPPPRFQVVNNPNSRPRSPPRADAA